MQEVIIIIFIIRALLCGEEDLGSHEPLATPPVVSSPAVHHEP